MPLLDGLSDIPLLAALFELKHDFRNVALFQGLWLKYEKVTTYHVANLDLIVIHVVIF